MAISTNTKEKNKEKKIEINLIDTEKAKEKQKDSEKEQKERDKALAVALKEIEKKFGSQVLIRMGDNQVEHIPVISTGSFGLDLALGVGGFPEGRVIEIYGPEGSGKTTLALHAIAEAQKKGYNCAFIDAEHAVDIHYAKQLGVNVNSLYLAQPDYGEQALSIIETLAKSGAFKLLVVDSVAALVPKAEIEGDIEDIQVGLQARLMSKSLRRIVSILNEMQVTIIFINQLRAKIGGMSYGPSETTTGGNALKFYASVRLDIRRIASLKQGETPIGNKIKIKVVKNKVAPPFKEVNCEIIFGKGISRTGELIDYGIKYDLIAKAGNTFSYLDKKLGGSRENSRAFLDNNKDVMKDIEEKLMSKIDPSAGEFDFVPDEKDDDILGEDND